MQNLKKPDFFILGAPKCGTTSMDAWLSEHPSIYMAEKEPHYFNTDHKNRKITDSAAYHALFAAATDTHLAIGETSVRYLYSQHAVANILNYNRSAKFIVMLRNPLDMAYSWHNQIYLSGLEQVKNFAQAWHLQDRRLAGHDIHDCAEPKMLNYGAVCSLGEQLQRLYNQVSADRVHLIFFDDLQQDGQKAYQAVLKFLAIADDQQNFTPEFKIHNAAQIRRIRLLIYLRPLFHRIKSTLGIESNFGISEFIQRKNIKTQNRQPLSDDMRNTLIDYFGDDVALLARLTDRNLTHWLQ